MSAAKDEADAGPELSRSEPESGLEEEHEEEETYNGDDGAGTSRRPTLSESDEKSSSIAHDADDHDHPQFNLLGTPQSEVIPAIRERPSSADGSLSIPDDTPSLQVAYLYTISYDTRMLISAGLCSFFNKQTSAIFCTW